MKPSSKLLRPVIERAPAKPARPTKPAAAERDLLVARKQAVEVDVKKLSSAAEGGLAERLKDTLAALRRDTSGRPKTIAGAVAIRVVGASCEDKKPVPLPNLHVTMETAAGATTSATTDVSGLAVLRLGAPEESQQSGDEPGKVAGKGKPEKGEPRATPEQSAATPGDGREPLRYRLQVTSSSGAELADVEGDPSRTHLLHLGDTKALEGHAVLGRGWLAALDKAAARHAEVTKTAEAQLTEHLCRAREQLAAIERRLDLHHKKA